MNIKKQKGVTLLALAITIAVIFIIVGTSAGMIVSEKGLLKSGQEVQNTQKNYAQAEEGKTNELIDSVGKVTIVEVESIKSNWEVINKIAKAIAEGRGEDENGKAVSSNSNQATVEIADKSYTIKVGDEFEITYDGVARTVRVLGFKHDELTNPTEAYGSGTKAKRAGISFEFLDCLGTHNMNGTDASTSTNANGWAATEMRKWLNGYTSNEAVQNVGINGIAKTLADNMGDNKENSGYKYIKQVKKQYIKTYSDADSNMENGKRLCSYDYLWLLAASEIFATGHQENAHAYAITTEGDQYKYYADLNPTWNSSNQKLVKKNNGSAYTWWLRSPLYYNATNFCIVSSDRQ